MSYIFKMNARQKIYRKEKMMYEIKMSFGQEIGELKFSIQGF